MFTIVSAVRKVLMGKDCTELPHWIMESSKL